MTDSTSPATLPTEAHRQWAACGSLEEIKGWLKIYVNPQLHLCLMAQLDAVYKALAAAGLDEVVTGITTRPTGTRDGLVVKYVLGTNFVQDGVPYEYRHLLTPNAEGFVISFETFYGKVGG